MAVATVGLLLADSFYLLLLSPLPMLAMLLLLVID